MNTGMSIKEFRNQLKIWEECVSHLEEDVEVRFLIGGESQRRGEVTGLLNLGGMFCDCSLEDTNRIRARDGLKPLK